MFLDPAAEAAVRQRVAGLERATGVEMIAAVIARADSYPEIPWKAFALGASLALLAAAAAKLLVSRSDLYRRALEDLKKKGRATLGGFTVGAGGGSWSSRGGSWSSGGGGFSGGGGSSGGGGASGSW